MFLLRALRYAMADHLEALGYFCVSSIYRTGGAGLGVRTKERIRSDAGRTVRSVQENILHEGACELMWLAMVERILAEVCSWNRLAWSRLNSRVEGTYVEIRQAPEVSVRDITHARMHVETMYDNEDTWHDRAHHNNLLKMAGRGVGVTCRGRSEIYTASLRHVFHKLPTEC